MSSDQRVALITGGGSGLGRASALALARSGARIVAADIDEDGAAATARLVVEQGGAALALPVDVTEAASVERMCGEAVRWGGRLDYALNSAGIGGMYAPTADYDEATWKQVIAVNLVGVWQSMRFEIPHMLRGGGVIVNLASVAGVLGMSGNSAYGASKHGVIGLTKAAALEYVRQGIRINALCPGYTRTPMVERMFEGNAQLEQSISQAMPIGRIGTPEEIAAAVVYLCSDAAAFMIGHALVIDGGIAAA
jgi:NAD(P)-dependent dehydrogenase (short-subunit alcohol dehydrogenase family)